MSFWWIWKAITSMTIIARLRFIFLKSSFLPGAVFKQSSDMTSFKEHVFFSQDYNDCNQCYHYCLQALCLRSQRYFLLHEIDEEMEYHASQYRTVAFKIDPCNDESHRDSAHKKVNHIKGIHHKSCLIGSRNKD